jgi:hypothetical protein
MRGNGIGLGLLDKLFDQLVANNFDILFISQPNEGKKFYSKALRKLFEIGKITSVRHTFLRSGYTYEVKI